jgi:steroid delta-isomerase
VTDRVSQHIAAFNDSIDTGDWGRFTDRFTPDATMSFVGVPAGPFRGRAAIAAAYLAAAHRLDVRRQRPIQR